MSITRIIVADRIMAGSLFQEEGFDVDQSAENLAEVKGQIIVAYLEERHPGVEVYADIGIQREAGDSRPVEVMAYASEEVIDPVESATIQKQLTKLLAEGTADLSWAVRIG